MPVELVAYLSDDSGAGSRRDLIGNRGDRDDHLLLGVNWNNRYGGNQGDDGAEPGY
jgi:hypothetical protein